MGAISVILMVDSSCRKRMIARDKIDGMVGVGWVKAKPQTETPSLGCFQKKEDERILQHQADLPGLG